MTIMLRDLFLPLKEMRSYNAGTDTVRKASNLLLGEGFSLGATVFSILHKSLTAEYSLSLQRPKVKFT